MQELTSEDFSTAVGDQPRIDSILDDALRNIPLGEGPRILGNRNYQNPAIIKRLPLDEVIAAFKDQKYLDKSTIAFMADQLRNKISGVDQNVRKWLDSEEARNLM